MANSRNFVLRTPNANITVEIPGEETFIIGGGEIYTQSIEIADKLDITKVHHSFGADTFFPEIYNESKGQIFNLFNDSKRRQLWIQIEDQLKYQQKRNIGIDEKLKPFLLFLKVLRYCFFCIFIGLFSIYTYEYFNQLGVKKSIEDILGFLWMSIPPIYAAIEGYIHFSDFKKTKKITTEIINLFKQFKLDLNKSKILNEFELIENKLFEAFTFENIEWFNEEKNKRLELKI